eukprot:259082_1
MGNVEAQKWYHDDLDTEKKLKIDQSVRVHRLQVDSNYLISLYVLFLDQHDIHMVIYKSRRRRKQFTSTRQYRKPGKRRKYFTQCLQQLVDARRRLCSDEKVVRNDAFQYVDTFIDNLPQQFKTKYHNN